MKKTVFLYPDAEFLPARPQTVIRERKIPRFCGSGYPGRVHVHCLTFMPASRSSQRRKSSVRDLLTIISKDVAGCASILNLLPIRTMLDMADTDMMQFLEIRKKSSGESWSMAISREKSTMYFLPFLVMRYVALSSE